MIKGGPDEHIVARAVITIDKDGELINTYAALKGTPGGSYVPEEIEVGMPVGYRGPFSYQIFRDHIARYYCDLIGQGGEMINIGPNAKNIHFENIRMRSGKPYSFEFDVIREVCWWIQID